MKITDEAVEAFTQYRRSQVAELRPWQSGDDMSGVSVSAEDAKAGSPKSGDMIARNPKNHADQWLVAAAYFADNFEPLADLPHLSQGAPTAADIRLKIALWSDDEGLELSMRQGDELARGIISALCPAPVGVTDDDPDEAYSLGKRDGYEEAVADIDCLTGGDGEYRYCTDADPDLHTPDAATMKQRIVDRFEALASHEPAPTDANDELERVDADANAMAWGAELKSAEARIFELEADLEIATDKVERLRKYEPWDFPADIQNLTAQLEASNARNAELVKALEPFAEVAGEWDGQPAALSIFLEWNDEPEAVPNVLVEDFRRARAALGGQSNG